MADSVVEKQLAFVTDLEAAADAILRAGGLPTASRYVQDEAAQEADRNAASPNRGEHFVRQRRDGP